MITKSRSNISINTFEFVDTGRNSKENSVLRRRRGSFSFTHVKVRSVLVMIVTSFQGFEKNWIENLKI